MGCITADRDKFELKLKERLSVNEKGRCAWSKKQLESVINMFTSCEAGKKKDCAVYHYLKNYELIKIGSEHQIIVKRKNDSDELIYIVPSEDYFPKVWEAHVQTGHGGRDRMVYYMKKRW